MDTEKTNSKLPISVVVATRNSEKTLEECLASIQKNQPAEIIVVDGNSSDRTVEIARRYTQRIYSDEGRGHSYASQLGAEQATQEYVAYIDSDVVLTERALENMLTDFRNSSFIVVSATQLPPTKRLNYWEWAAYHRGQLSKSRRREEGFLGTLACLFRRETILKYRFDSGHRYAHDLDLEMRLKKDGHKLGISSALVYHYHPYNFRSFVRWQFLLGKATPYHMKKFGIWHIHFWPPVYTIYWLGYSIIKGKLKLIPYLLIDGCAKTGGMVEGFFELMGSALKRSKKSGC